MLVPAISSTSYPACDLRRRSQSAQHRLRTGLLTAMHVTSSGCLQHECNRITCFSSDTCHLTYVRACCILQNSYARFLDSTFVGCKALA
jgi:hypothetical protein